MIPTGNEITKEAQAEEVVSQRPTSRGVRRNMLSLQTIAVGLAVLIVIAGGAAAYLYNEYASLTKDPTAKNQQKIDEAVKKVSALIDVPEGEEPTLASITDAESLKDQPFFQNAKVGDVVLLYNTARKAYLYRPSQNILVEVASLGTEQ